MSLFPTSGIPPMPVPCCADPVWEVTPAANSRCASCGVYDLRATRFWRSLLKGQHR